MKTIATIAAVLLLAAGPAAGQEWELSTDLTASSYSIAGISGAETGEAWAAFAGYLGEGKIFYYDATNWIEDVTLYPGGTAGEIRNLHMDDSGDWGYIVGNDYGGPGHIWRYTGVSYSLQTQLVGGSLYLYSVAAPDSYHAWAGGNSGNVYCTTDGVNWAIQTCFGAGIFVQSLSGTNSNDVWAVAGPGGSYDSNSIYHYEEGGWEVQTTINIRLYSVSTAGGGRVWASGYDGIILQGSGGEWSVSTDVGNSTVHSITAGDRDRAWAGLNSGAILYFNGTSWSVETETSSTQGINAIAVSEAGEVWAGARSDGRVYRREIPPIRPWIYDFNGDGTSDITVFRGSSGLWAVRGVTRAYFGQSGDTPSPGDFDGDGTTDIAVFRPGSGLWAARGVTRVYFGISTDRPIPADFSGDGTAAPALFRSTSGLWAIRGLTRAYFGTSGDVPIPADYRAEGAAMIAIFRPSTGLWAARSFSRVYFGQSGDTPIPAAYDEGGAMPGIFRGSNGLWALIGSTRFYFGQTGDAPLPFHYSGADSARPAIFREPTGLWAVRGHTRIYFGQTGDLPLAR